MRSPRLAIAAGNKLGTEAAINVARAGGNGIDACLAAAIMGWVAEPFFTSIGGSGFITIRTPADEVEVIDGNNAMPLTTPSEPGQGIKRIFLPDYADGIYMGIGGGSVAVPGVLAAIRTAWERHGKIEWEALFADAIRAARDGFPFPRTSDYYLSCTWETIWSKYPAARAMFGPDDEPLREGDTFAQPELAESLELIATKGPDVFYQGDLARDMAEAMAADGGFMTVDDLTAYVAEIRSPISTEAFGWTVSSNPPPAVGGAVLIHMLALLQNADLSDEVERLRAIVEAQRAAVGYRKERYQDPDGVAAAFTEALKELQLRSQRSGDTTHMSAADSDGYVCSLTESNGYGAGLIVRGMLLNNTLGEEELNPLGAHRLPPGSRTHSNMTPTIARGDGITLGLGSPGADRIVGSIAQTFIRIAVEGASIQEAVTAPRAHLDPRPEGEKLCYEPGLPGDQLGYSPRPYDELHMYFGAVQTVAVRDDGSLEAAHDPRRSGGSALV
ncbi:MAG: gamma-glutamyltransferase [Actinomycetota bacterium]|nr:gamma-glutamyltransferase [Actinomycetota bacterium]